MRENLIGEVDRKLWEDVESVQETLQDLPDSSAGLDFSKYKDSSAHDVRDRWILEIWTSDQNKKLFSVPNKIESPIGSPAPSECEVRRGSPRDFRSEDGLNLRTLCSKVEFGDRTAFVRVARSSERALAELRELLFMILIAAPICIGIALIGGYLLARKSLAPVIDMTEQAEKITADRLSERLQIPNPNDELGRLATTFNRTFERLEKSFKQMKQFTSDASHELRTPLTAIRTMGEVILRENRNPEEYKEIVSSILEEADELRHLIDSLLTLSRADAGQTQINKKKENLSEVVSEILDHFEVLSEEKDQIIVRTLESDFFANVDRSAFRQAVINLVVNAIKYSPNNSVIKVRTYLKESFACIEVKDDGPGISPEHHSKIFERFYRIDSGRSRDVGGTGLGLAIAKWAVEAHGGNIKLVSEAGKGSAFTIELPIGV